MAGVSKVSYGDEVLIDLTADTVNPDVLLSGYSAHSANGDQIRGALVLGALAYMEQLDYWGSYLINRPKLGALAYQNTADYETQITGKPDFGDLAFQDSVDYESGQLLNKPISAADLLDILTRIYPDFPKGLKLAIGLTSRAVRLDGIAYYADNGIHVYQEYSDWFSYLPGYHDSGIIINIKENLTDFVKPILGALAYQDFIDYRSDQIINKPVSSEEILDRILEIYPDLPPGISFAVNAASQNAITFQSDVLSYVDEDNGILFHPDNTADITSVYISEDSGVRFTFPSLQNQSEKTINKILEIYPNIPSGVLFAFSAAANNAISLSNDILAYESDDNGVVVNSENSEGVTASYIPENNGILFNFPPLQFISDVPDDGKLYARSHGGWVELNM